MIKALFAWLLAGSLFGCSGDDSTDADKNGSGGVTGASETSAFGAACTTAADCSGPTNYCAAPPLATKFCTANMPSCDDAATTCPEGWPCLDLNAFGIPAIVCDRR